MNDGGTDEAHCPNRHIFDNTSSVLSYTFQEQIKKINSKLIYEC